MPGFDPVAFHPATLAARPAMQPILPPPCDNTSDVEGWRARHFVDRGPLDDVMDRAPPLPRDGWFEVLLDHDPQPPADVMWRDVVVALMAALVAMLIGMIGFQLVRLL
jgi:hypothetical protein